MSDTNAELVRLGNQVALLEEEKGNLQLSLVDFDELKGRNQDKRFIVDVSVVLVMLSDFQMRSVLIFLSEQLLFHSLVFSIVKKKDILIAIIS